MIVKLYCLILHELIDDCKAHVRVDDTCPVSEKKCKVHYLTGFCAFDNNVYLHPLPLADKIMMNCRDCH